MMRVAMCITQEHDLRLVALALLVCLIGSSATIQLFGRIRSASGQIRLGWIMLAAVATGTTVWATHFVAMMAFRTQAPVVLDPLMTLLSLMIAIALAAPGLAIAAHRRTGCGLAGGAIVGVAIALMHYFGMSAYRVDGIVTWAWGYVAASVLLSVTLGGVAFYLLTTPRAWRRTQAVSVLSLAVAALHFTGMTAMDIAVVKLGDGLSDLTMAGLAIATAMASLIIVGCAAISALIDGHTQGESYRRLRRMALHDGLTDLPNRMSFHEELERRFLMKDGRACMAVVMMDLSRFKVVNDTYGHHAGDQLLIALATRLAAIVKPAECVARLGGDEFAAVVSYDRPEELTDFLDRLRAVFATPFVFDRFTAAIGANTGVALAVHDGFDADALLAKADLAMYRAKSVHSPEPCFYDAQMDDAARDRRELVAELRDAIETEAFELHFQVQAAVATGEITGYEALVRWKHPTKGMIPPTAFIPLAEESGEIVPLSRWILQQACFEAALWPNRHVISVNLSPKHLGDPGLVDTVRTALENSGLSPERLTLELTESAIIHDRRFALEQLQALKAMGIGIALDDFGVGYSSLDVLRSVPFDCIKLDASFVAEIEHDEQAVSILRSVAALGRTLNMRVLAEGVEEPGQLAIAAREGCAAIQGYLIGRPSRTLMDPERVRRTMMPKPRSVPAITSAA
ncbi:putative bifunctional diguanylate cyclase/phosphodiesterase [Sphingomonas sp. CFBP 13720]|uniref:putative bifunctional diguanylate cyclase/phosphodiesterase n=1 Tax=Sphingomonas sp. CFBP 13720 TaxID=2775302 RepID=UPI00177AEA22|nr:EAL domain-containing protein [Sphingomonas sp. CFBP 13720]MBD8677681.1 EAL domain-containing protein [Sphingomonas sp. CFBP 13720]